MMMEGPEIGQEIVVGTEVTIKEETEEYIEEEVTVDETFIKIESPEIPHMPILRDMRQIAEMREKKKKELKQEKYLLLKMPKIVEMKEMPEMLELREMPDTSDKPKTLSTTNLPSTSITSLPSTSSTTNLPSTSSTPDLPDTTEPVHEEILIAAVHERPVLWDRMHWAYNKKFYAQKAWDEIASILGFSSKVAKQKWKTLRDYHRVMYKKRKSGPVCGSETGWKYYPLMNFLTDTYQIKAINGRNFELNDNEETQHSAITFIEQSQLSTNIENGSNEESTSQVEDSDEDYLFFKEILPQLKSLSNIKKFYVKMKFQELLYTELLALEKK